MSRINLIVLCVSVLAAIYAIGVAALRRSLPHGTLGLAFVALAIAARASSFWMLVLAVVLIVCAVLLEVRAAARQFTVERD